MLRYQDMSAAVHKLHAGDISRERGGRGLQRDFVNDSRRGRGFAFPSSGPCQDALTQINQLVGCTVLEQEGRGQLNEREGLEISNQAEPQLLHHCYPAQGPIDLGIGVMIS